MKTKLFLLSACAGLFLLASCSHGPSAETKTKVAALDSAWSAMNTAAKAVSDSLTACTTMCESCCKEGEAMECCDECGRTPEAAVERHLLDQQHLIRQKQLGALQPAFRQEAAQGLPRRRAEPHGQLPSTHADRVG